MINVTERAKQELKRLHDSYVDWPGGCLRLMERGEGQLGLGIDLEEPGDKIVEYEGIRLLTIEPGLATNIRRITLDVNDTPEGAELVLGEEP